MHLGRKQVVSAQVNVLGIRFGMMRLRRDSSPFGTATRGWLRLIIHQVVYIPRKDILCAGQHVSTPWVVAQGEACTPFPGCLAR